MAPGANAITDGAVLTLIGLATSTGFILALFIGFLVIAGFTKFRKVGPRSLVVRNLVDRMGDEPVRTPELLEQRDKPSS